MSQEELSRLTGGLVSQGAISSLEKRDSSSSEFTVPLATALGVPVNELLTGQKESGAIFVRAPVLDDLDALLPEDADVWRGQIRAAAVKARRNSG